MIKFRLWAMLKYKSTDIVSGEIPDLSAKICILAAQQVGFFFSMAFDHPRWNQKFLRKQYRRANKMRRKPTPIERYMANILKSLNISFNQQYSIDRYTVDFELPGLRLIFETDGFESHHTGEQIDRDRLRDARLNHLGYEVVHIPGWQVFRNVIIKNFVMETIERRKVRLAKPDLEPFGVGIEITTDRPLKRQPAMQGE